MATVSKPQDAIQLLKADHRKVEELFEKFENARAKNVKAKLAHQICLELCVHATIEEEIFYPGAKESLDEEIYTEAYVEHDGAKLLIAEILEGSPEDDFYDAKVKVLSEMIKHHVKEEEQKGGMFDQVKKGDVDLKALGMQLKARKDALTEQFSETGIPTPETLVMKGVDMRRGEQPSV